MMHKFLAIVVYKCFVNGEKTDYLDFTVIYFEDHNIENVKKRIKNIPDHYYYNTDNEIVMWKYAKIFSIDYLVDCFVDGQEVVGFIADIDEITNL